MKKFLNLHDSFLSSIILWFTLLIIFLLILSLSNINITLSNPYLYLVTTIILIAITLATIFYYRNLSRYDKEKKESFFRNIWTGIAVLFTYFFISVFQGIPLLLFTNDINNIPLTIKVIYLLIVEFLELGIIAFILRKQIVIAIKDLKQNFKSYLSSNIKYYFIAVFIMVISNLLIGIVNLGNIAGNEEAVRETFLKAPLYMYISAVIIAPLLEELVFRLGIRNLISNNKIFIITSGLIFGGLHVIGNVNSIVDILYLIPYSAPGMAFAYMLTKTNNILVPTAFHFLHNGITMTLQVFIIIFGM